MNATTPFQVFDIECSPDLAAVEKYTDPFPPFIESEVKVGNLKDVTKIAEKIAAAKLTHESERTAYWAKAVSEAALNPYTGGIVCIGIAGDEGKHVIMEGDETHVLAAFWDTFMEPGNAHRKWCYWSGCGNTDENFDPDYIVIRSRILGVKVPGIVRQGNGRYYSERFIDLAKIFLLHRRNAYMSLSKAADILGLYERPDLSLKKKGKDDPCRGETFHLFWDGKAENEMTPEAQKALAIEYLVSDLEHARQIALRIL